MTDDGLEKIKTKKDKTIHIIQFAKMSEVNMIIMKRITIPFWMPTVLTKPLKNPISRRPLLSNRSTCRKVP